MKLRKRTIAAISVASVILVAIIVAVVLFLVNASGQVLSCENVGISEEMYAYWQAYYRRTYVKNAARAGVAEAADTEEFWATKDTTGKTHGEKCDEETRLYVARIATAAHLFDSTNRTLTEEDRTKAHRGIEYSLTYRFDGSEERYNAAAEKYGFTIEAAKQAALLEYKRELLRQAVEGDQSLREEYLEDYYQKNYVHVKMVYVEVPNATAGEAYDNYLARVAEYRAAVAESDARFYDLVKSSENTDFGEKELSQGYYFAPLDRFTTDYQKNAPNVVDAIFSIEQVGGYTEVRTQVEGKERIYFIRRYELAELDVIRALYYDIDGMFENVDRFAADTYFVSWRDSFLDRVEWNEDNIPAWTPGLGDEDLIKFFGNQ